MADYKELIRKAIQALPENNGAARRAVYEKARAALVGQLRGLNPPLAARDITQHRLQLEDCIRQVEQEASEAVIAGLKQNEDLPFRQALPPPRPANPSLKPPPSQVRPAAPNGARPSANGAPPARPGGSIAARQNGASAARPLAAAPRAATAGKPVTPVPVPRIAAGQGTGIAAIATARPAGAVRPIPRQHPAALSRAAAEAEPALDTDYEPETIEDIIAAAENDVGEAPGIDTSIRDEGDETAAPSMFRIEPRQERRPAANGSARAEGRALPAIVARAEAAKAAPSARQANGSDATSRPGQPGRGQPNGRQPHSEPIQMPRVSNGSAAMSSIREVDLEHSPEGDPQIAIERAIATLEREARNDGDDADTAEAAVPAGRQAKQGRRRESPDQDREHERDHDRDRRDVRAEADSGFARAPVERERGGSAVTIFLLVFLGLLIVAGGAGLLAWREGFIDFDAMFGKTPQTVVATTTSGDNQVTAPDTASSAPTGGKPAVQTNTEPSSSAPAQSGAALSSAPGSAPVAPPSAASAEPSAQINGASKSEERLPQTSDNATAPAATDAGKPAAQGAAAAGGSQSLLLEASQDGTQGAVPFSGTVDWSEGKDEMGQPTLVGKANIPARNLGVSVLIRKNSDPTLPASHLMEINFTVNDSFIGGSIAGLPGVLLKNEELVQGTPLVGASARVVGNSFLFALSSSPADEATNKDLLTSRKWIDLAIIYATGKKAIITLEKDDKAEQMFTQVFDAWTKSEAGKAGTPAPTPLAPVAPAAGK